MRALLLALLVLASRPAMADEDPLLLHARELESHGQKLRLEGMITTVTGAAMLVGSAILWLRNDTECSLDCSGGRFIFLALGLPVTVFGATTWWIGDDEMAHGRRLMASVRVTF